MNNMYSIVQQMTGEIWGGENFGPIDGELTKASIQKVVVFMVHKRSLLKSS